MVTKGLQEIMSCKRTDQGALADKIWGGSDTAKAEQMFRSFPSLLQGSKKLLRIPVIHSKGKGSFLHQGRCWQHPAKGLGGERHPAATSASRCSTVCLGFPLSGCTDNHSHPFKGLQPLWVQNSAHLAPTSGETTSNSSSPPRPKPLHNT